MRKPFSLSLYKSIGSTMEGRAPAFENSDKLEDTGWSNFWGWRNKFTVFGKKATGSNLQQFEGCWTKIAKAGR